MDNYFKKILFNIILVLLIFILIVKQFNLNNNDENSKNIKESFKNIEGFKNKKLNNFDGYRLGDMVRGRHKWGGYDEHIKKFKNSIAYEYLNSTEKDNDFNTLFRIVKNRKQKNHIPDSNMLIIHCRTGDVLNNINGSIDDILNDSLENKFYKLNTSNFKLYVKNYNYYKNIIPYCKKNNIKNIIIVYGSHFNVDIKRSHEYVEKIKLLFEKNNFNVNLRYNQNPDDDFLFMSNATYFLPSGGGFSKIISEMIKMNNKNVL